ncbi:MAG: fucose isomerase [Clostridia bacterium]|nr:fucose isomerase [Clostridia bacterium]
MEFQAIYLPIGVGTFHLPSAEALFQKSAALLKTFEPDVVCPQEMLLSVDKLDAFLEGRCADFAIVQNVTFANAAYISEILRRLDCPILLWTLREPVVDGTRLRLNSLTGAFSAANTLKSFGRPFEYVFGSPDEARVQSAVSAVFAAARMKKAMRELRLLQVGHTPQGFGFGRALDGEMLRTFGVRLESVEARELIEDAKACSDERIEAALDDARGRIRGLDGLPEQNVRDFARLYAAYADYVRAHRIGALASRCWPDFFTAFGTPVCAALSLLNDLGVASACEADAYGALSMYVASFLTGKSAFFGDPVSLDENENTVTFWHCGMAPCSLARTDTGACAGLHCNRGIGPVLEFGCERAEKVTVFRIGRRPDGGFRFFLARGEALDKPKQFSGVSVVVRTDSDARALVETAVRDGWEPHFAVAFGDIADAVTALGHMLGVPVEAY